MTAWVNCLSVLYEKYYAPNYPILKPLNSMSGGAAFTKAQEQMEWQETYKQMTLERLRQMSVSGFPMDGGAMTIPFLELQLPFDQLGTVYKAQKAIERTASDFTFEAIENLQKDGTHRLPLELTPELMTLMGMSNTALPENTKLLITAFEVNGGTSLSLSTTKVEFTLLVKLEDKYAQFVRKNAKVSADAVEMRDFYLFLDADVPLNSSVFKNGAIQLKKGKHASGIPKPEEDSYALLLCEGFQKFNVQGTYAVPFAVKGDFPEGILKIRDKDKRDPKEAESQLSLDFRIDQSSDINQFIAGGRNKNASGSFHRFVSEGQESVIFTTNENSEVYLDFSADKNQKDMPDNLDESFQGLYFVKMLAELDGFHNKLKQNITTSISEFYFSPLSGFGSNGMGGTAIFTELLDWDDNVRLGGWQYSIDRFTIDFTNAAFNKEASPYTILGANAMPNF